MQNGLMFKMVRQSVFCFLVLFWGKTNCLYILSGLWIYVREAERQERNTWVQLFHFMRTTCIEPCCWNEARQRELGTNQSQQVDVFYSRFSLENTQRV